VSDLFLCSFTSYEWMPFDEIHLICSDCHLIVKLAELIIISCFLVVRPIVFVGMKHGLVQ
jgi:hypothetical protein